VAVPAVQAGRGHQLHGRSRRSAAERPLAVCDGARHGLRALTSRVVDGGADSLVALGRILLLLLRLRHVRAGAPQQLPRAETQRRGGSVPLPGRYEAEVVGARQGG
jgi:hypothetical protein